LGIVWRIRSTALTQGDKHWLSRVADQYGAALDVPAQSRRDRHPTRRSTRKLIKQHGRAPRVLITVKLKSYVTN
jgi:putative transposase